MKRFLPLISLILVSLFVSICALGVIYVLSVDAHTVEEKIQSMLTLGVPSALALIVLLWFGAGMDFVLSRLKQRSTRVTVSLFTYIFVPIVLCIGLPALAATLIYGVFMAPKGWKQLPAPPEPAVQAVAGTAGSVTIRTDAGAYYFCSVNQPTTCWEPADEPESGIIAHANETDTPPNFEPPDGTINLLGIAYTDMGENAFSYYAILQDGSVWYLLQDANRYEAGFASGLFLTLAIIPAIAGLMIIYLGAGISAFARWMAG